MKIAIIDDELHNRLVIRRIIEHNCPQLDIVVDEGIIEKAVEEINAQKPDLIFLDIRLKNGTGFDIVEKLTYTPKIVFTTAYSEYAMKAFKVHAVDYLLKPIDERELTDSVTKLEKLLAAKQQPASNVYAYALNGEKKTIDYDEIFYFESSGTHTYMATATERVLLPKNIGEVEKELSGTKFYRTHHSYIVNLKKIRSIDVKRNGQINLMNDDAIPVSQRRLSDFLDLIKHTNVS
jgi:two-component system LytT family response regulator